MKRYDTIEIVEKNIDEIEEVEKFNPFHDARGRFSNKNGFRSYSANPKTKAGAMAIQRSQAGGHGRTLNVHAESKGESIQQNANWLATGQKPRTPAAVSRARYQQRKQKQQQAQQQAQQATTAAPKQQPTQTKPTTQKPTQKPQTKPQGDTDRQPVDGTDLVAKMGKAKVKNMTVDEVLEAQGFNGKPQVAKTEAEFKAAIKKHGNIGVRSWDAYDDATMAAYDDQLKNGDFYTKCSGGNALGRGMYVAVSTAKTDNSWGGLNQGEMDYAAAYKASRSYGPWHCNMTIDASAKLISQSDVTKMAKKDGFKSQSWSGTDSVNFDIGAYAAAKGYDGVIMDGWNGGKSGKISDNSALKGTYVNMVNRTKVIIYENSGKNKAGDLRNTTSFAKNGYISTT